MLVRQTITFPRATPESILCIRKSPGRTRSALPIQSRCTVSTYILTCSAHRPRGTHIVIDGRIVPPVPPCTTSHTVTVLRRIAIKHYLQPRAARLPRVASVRILNSCKSTSRAWRACTPIFVAFIDRYIRSWARLAQRHRPRDAHWSVCCVRILSCFACRADAIVGLAPQTRHERSRVTHTP